MNINNGRGTRRAPQIKNIMEEKNSYRMDVNKQVGRALADLRQHQGMTIEAAATATDTTPDKLADIERGYIPHNVHNLARIVEALGGRLAIMPTDNPGLKHCEFIAGPPVKKPTPTPRRSKNAVPA